MDMCPAKISFFAGRNTREHISYDDPWVLHALLVALMVGARFEGFLIGDGPLSPFCESLNTGCPGRKAKR